MQARNQAARRAQRLPSQDLALRVGRARPSGHLHDAGRRGLALPLRSVRASSDQGAAVHGYRARLGLAEVSWAGAGGVSAADGVVDLA